MGFKTGKIIRHEGFEPLELNEGNVQAIFNRCLAKKNSTVTLQSDLFPVWSGYLDSYKILHGFDFDSETILKNIFTINYLFGQLNCVHISHVDRIEQERLTIDDFITNYLGQRWVNDKETLMQLLYLGNCSKINVIFPFSATKNHTTCFASAIKPTLSPKDPNFPSWWEAHKSEWAE